MRGEGEARRGRASRQKHQRLGGRPALGPGGGGGAGRAGAGGARAVRREGRGTAPPTYRAPRRRRASPRSPHGPAARAPASPHKKERAEAGGRGPGADAACMCPGAPAARPAEPAWGCPAPRSRAREPAAGRGGLGAAPREVGGDGFASPCRDLSACGRGAPRAGINSAVPRLTARPGERGAGGSARPPPWDRLGALGDSAPRSRSCPDTGCDFSLSVCLFLGRARAVEDQQSGSKLFTSLSPQHRGDAGSGGEFAAPEKGGKKRVNSCGPQRQPLPRDPPPAPPRPARRRPHRPSLPPEESAHPSGPGCSFASSPLPWSS